MESAAFVAIACYTLADHPPYRPTTFERFELDRPNKWLNIHERHRAPTEFDCLPGSESI
jgi:hypothetical protein